MAYEVVMPQLGLSMDSGQIVEGALARAVEEALVTGPDEREFLWRCADLLRELGRIEQADALLLRAAEAPPVSVR